MRGRVPNSSGQNALNRRAVAYVRMSTERQEYSTLNQLEMIEKYAADRSLVLVATYEDSGRSGLTKKGRPGLCRLIEDVQREHDFAFILVYDITRWGRFQDIDESAYYEYLCRINGVNVAYCAEVFENDGSPYASIIKALKRIAAADFSRELSVKVFKGQCRIISLGYKVGGQAGYGLRRVLLDDNGEVLQILRQGERKALQNYRVVLAPGPDFEIAVVNQIFQWYVDGAGDRRIAAVLNEQGIATERGGPWTHDIVRYMLKSEKYIGNLIYNRSSFKLHKKYVRNPPSEWVRCEKAFPPIVPEELFNAALAERQYRYRRYRREALLECIRRVYEKHGRVTSTLIDLDKDGPNARLIGYHFGSMRKAFVEAGLPPMDNDLFLETRSRLYALRGEMIQEIFVLIAKAGGSVALDELPYTIIINGGIKVSVRAIRCDHDLKYDYYRWRIPKRMSQGVEFVLFAQMDQTNCTVLGYYLFEKSLFMKDIAFTQRSSILYEKYRRNRLAEFFSG